MPKHSTERANSQKIEKPSKVKLIHALITFFNSRRKFIEHTRLLSNFLNN